MTLFEIGLVVASALLHALWSVFIKDSGDPLAFNLLQKVAPLSGTLFLIPWLPLGEIPAPVWGLLALTGVVHGFYFYWMSRAYEAGDLTLVYPIARSTPALLPLVAVPLLGESISPGGAVGIAVVVAGIWFVHAGRGLVWSSFGGAAAGFAYLTLLTTVVYSLTDKAAMTGFAAVPWSSPVPRALVFCLFLTTASSVFFVPLVLRRRGLRVLHGSTRGDLGRAVLASCISMLSYGLILKALETAPVSYVVAVRQTSVLFALVLGTLWLGERPGWSRVLGGAATVAGVALIAWYA